jgi:hypothetical protein
LDSHICNFNSKLRRDLFQPLSFHSASAIFLSDHGRKMPEKKYVVDSRNFPWAFGWVSWSLPFETLLYSSLESKDSSVTVCISTPVTQYDSVKNWENIFLGPPWAITWFWTSDLDNNYFNLPSTPYGQLTSLQSDSSFKEQDFNNQNVFIVPLQNEVTSSKEVYIIVPLHILNTSGKKICAVPDVTYQVFLSYHVMDEKGKAVSVDNVRTPLEMDINKEGNTGLIVNTQLKKGKYTLLIDFVTENIRWWNIDAKVTLFVK